jgi:hypothetical protein
VDHGLVDGVGGLWIFFFFGWRGEDGWKEGKKRSDKAKSLSPLSLSSPLTLSGKMQVDRQDTSLATPRLWHSCMMLSCGDLERGREGGEKKRKG